ncbi:hypothetical protein ZYGR_0AI02140 [Zygosaccharomyces rouxii]|uniref:precorrin-2 dehydrogenase n=1 Tax=Zygosaccharomyces rouxii TaxID=4956 RepID=A0A1Q2ZX68_ZYGRO|nr:hypothetical protein ZYGR_0I02140 [Zygosaccharomyces rouxii]GAV52932.1 hypothetical protein ZYGR_0AI02140 [Zygosaccharomyces rouxii]
MKPKSLLLAHQLRNKNVLVIGAGDVALTRLKKLIPTGCKITIIGPEINPQLKESYCSHCDSNTGIDDQWQLNGGVYRYIPEKFQDDYLSLYQDGANSNWALILVCIPDGTISKHIYSLAKTKFGQQQLINVADDKPMCDVYFGANWEDESLQILISSNGAGPRFTALLRDEIGQMLSELQLSKSVEKLQVLRSSVQSRARGPKATKFRMKWMSRCTEIFGVRNCHQMDINSLLNLFQEMYSKGTLEFPSDTISKYSI